MLWLDLWKHVGKIRSLNTVRIQFNLLPKLAKGQKWRWRLLKIIWTWEKNKGEFQMGFEPAFNCSPGEPLAPFPSRHIFQLRQSTNGDPLMFIFTSWFVTTGKGTFQSYPSTNNMIQYFPLLTLSLIETQRVIMVHIHLMEVANYG